jgi:hypothetical protein
VRFGAAEEGGDGEGEAHFAVIVDIVFMIYGFGVEFWRWV